LYRREGFYKFSWLGLTGGLKFSNCGVAVSINTGANERIVDKSRQARNLHLEPQVEQLLGEAQLPQEELAVLLNFPPTEKAKADMTRRTFLLLHLGHAIFSEVFNTNFSNSFSH